MIRLESVTKRYGEGPPAVDSLDLEVEAGEVCMLVGPSGCGKTTTVKMVNRLVEPTSGRILVGGEDVSSVDPVQLRRRIGYVIQQVGLFPHLTVAQNVGTVPRLLGWDRRRVERRGDELLELVGLEPAVFRRRYPRQLSGGQRQRVGVARALGADPPVLLMDEPFGAIDPVTRLRLQDEFRKLQGELAKTVLFVTHDVDEAVKLGDRIAVMAEGGVLAQHGSPSEVLARPASPFVAGFVGAERALTRLGVMPIDLGRLLQPPQVAAGAALAEARAAMDRAGCRWAVVLEEGDDSVPQVLERSRAEGEGGVRDRATTVPARVESRASLREALATMLLHESGCVAVMEGGRLCGLLTPETLHRAASTGPSAPRR